jgi:hypothetical protein
MRPEEYTKNINQIEAEYLESKDFPKRLESIRLLNEKADIQYGKDFDELYGWLTRHMPMNARALQSTKKKYNVSIELHKKAGASIKALARHSLNTPRAVEIKSDLNKCRRTLENVLLRQYPDADLSIYY